MKVKITPRGMEHTHETHDTHRRPARRVGVVSVLAIDETANMPNIVTAVPCLSNGLVRGIEADRRRAK